MSAPETWQVTMENVVTGERREIALDVVEDACICDGRPGEDGHCACAPRWIARGSVDGDEHRGTNFTAARAVVAWCANAHPWTWVPVEIRAPGELPRETGAARAAAIARAVNDEIEACARVCDDLARKLDVERDETVVDHEGEMEEACAETARDLAAHAERWAVVYQRVAAVLRAVDAADPSEVYAMVARLEGVTSQERPSLVATITDRLVPEIVEGLGRLAGREARANDDVEIPKAPAIPRECRATVRPGKAAR